MFSKGGDDGFFAVARDNSLRLVAVRLARIELGCTGAHLAGSSAYPDHHLDPESVVTHVLNDVPKPDSCRWTKDLKYS